VDQPLTGLIVYQLKAKSRKVKAQEHLKHLASETWSRIQDERIWVLNLRLRSQSFETSEISVRDLLEITISRPSRDLNFETFSRSQFRDLLEISISRPLRSQSETFSKSQFRDLLEISVPRPSRDLNPETFLRSQSRDLLEISISRPSRDLSSETFSRSQFRDLLEISIPRPSRNLSSETFSRSQSRDLLEISVPRPSRDLNKNSKFKCQQPNPILIPEDQGTDNYSNPSITDCLAANQGRASNWLGDCHSMPI
jgi:hypothetical protein